MRLLISFVIAGVSVLPGQTAAEGGTGFDVATIKQSRPEEQLSIRVKGRQFLTTDTTLNDLIAFAYGLHAQQITRAPAFCAMIFTCPALVRPSPPDCDRYDFSLTWTPEPPFGDGTGASPAPRTAREDEPAGLYAAIQQQLGLKLQPARAPVDVIVIEAAERPSTN